MGPLQSGKHAEFASKFSCNDIVNDFAGEKIPRASAEPFHVGRNMYICLLVYLYFVVNNLFYL